MKRSGQRGHATPAHPASARRPSRAGSPTNFPVVGVGASAGGLEAFTHLLGHLPPDSGMAFVFVQHLDRSHVSYLSEALGNATKMPVSQVRDGMRIEPNHVYVIPPNADMAVLHGVLTLLPRHEDPRKLHLPIDFFFNSLAADRGSQAIGVILSGTASDGTEGLRAIKAEEGITFAESADSAKFTGMPDSARAAGVVDYSLPTAQIARELLRLSHHPYLTTLRGGPSVPKGEQELKKVFVLLRKTVGVDFSEYKTTTFRRRLARRMALQKTATLQEYLTLLRESPVEAVALHEDILIHVTSFFRDPDVFAELQARAYPAILAARAEGTPIRIWVAGCSTGEEVYSVAICLLEVLDREQRRVPIQVFGSDVSQRAIDRARAGVYVDAAVRNVNKERLARYFTRVEGGYRINKAVRDLCVFARHDLARDPPFSNLDLVSCRNVLIYFGAPLQKRVLATFHYCLRRPGFLLLGRTEHVSGFAEYFSAVDKEHRLYQRTEQTSRLRFPRQPELVSPAAIGEQRPIQPSRHIADVVKHVDRLLLAEYTPPGVIINEAGEVLQFRGRTGPFLEPAPGVPEYKLFKMARKGLLQALRVAIEQAKKQRRPVRKEGVQVEQNGAPIVCDLVVSPIAGVPEAGDLYLVMFEEVTGLQPLADSESRKRPSRASKVKQRRQNSQLETELANAREYLQSVLEEQQRTNDELASANEELVSGNEELQSMNEEIETAKEELQSTNEELSTVNDELHNRNRELNQVNNDLVNLLNAVELPIIILDAGRRIRRFTPRARSMLNILPTDVGRPIDDIKLNIDVADLDSQIAEAIEMVAPKQREVRGRDGRWYRMEIRPYKTLDNRIDGAVLSMVDITSLKQTIGEAEWSRDYARGIVEAVQVPLVIFDSEMRVVSANHAFYADFDAPPSSVEGKTLPQLGAGWSHPEVRAALDRALARGTRVEGIEFEAEFPRIGRRTMSLSAGTVATPTGVPMVLLAIADISDRKQNEKERARLLAEAEAAKKEADRANRMKDQFLATLSHELRTPLSTMLMQSQLLRAGKMNRDKIIQACDVIERSVHLQSQLIADLLDVSRIVAGKLKMELEPVAVQPVVRAAVDAARAQVPAKPIDLQVELDPSVGAVMGDPVRLQQVAWNLLVNALKFTPAHGRVKVTLDSVEGQARLRVIDNGQGIAREFLPRIFDRFTQENSTNSRVYAGLGLGLAIVRHIVEQHGGKVTGESAGLGKGSTFTVTIPLAPEGQGRARRAPVPTARAPKHNGDLRLDGLRVLVVEDDAAARSALVELLSLWGATVEGAASAAEAFAALSAFKPALMLCDIAMPGEDGYSMIRRVRALTAKRGGTTPAIALTALASDEDRQRALAAGFQEHLPKPVDVDRLGEAVAALASRNAPAPKS